MGIEYTTEGSIDPERHDEARELYEAEQERNAAAPPPANDELRIQLAKAIHKENDLCVREGAEESWDAGYECQCCQMADAVLPLLAQVAARARAEAYEDAARFVEANTPYQQGVGSVGVAMAKYLRERGAELQKAAGE